MVQLLSFLDIQHYQSLNGRFFKNIELTIGATLRKIANEPVEKSTYEEVRITLNDKKKTMNTKMETYLLGLQFHFIWVEVNAAQGIVMIPFRVMLP